MSRAAIICHSMENFAITRSLKSEVEPQGLVDVFHDGVSYLTNAGTQPVN